MALWKNEILIFLFVNIIFFALINVFITNDDTYSTIKPKPFFDGWPHLLDLKNFKYTINSNVCKIIGTPILVHSYIGNFEFRHAIRRSYSRTVLKQLGFRFVFMIGLSDNENDQTRLLQESLLYGDIVQGNFQEAYRNLTYKHVMSLTWFVEHCQELSTHMVKMDDDIAINVFKLKRVVERNYDLAGCVVKSRPIRDKRNKWYVSRKEFIDETYPDFLSGWLYVARMISIKRLMSTIRNKEYFWIDDLYITGILAKRAQIELTDLRSDFETDPGPIYCCINKQQRCEFLAAPSGDDYTLIPQYSKQLIKCKITNSTCDAYRKSKRHHTCLDLWKKSVFKTQKGKPSIEILN